MTSRLTVLQKDNGRIWFFGNSNQKIKKNTYNNNNNNNNNNKDGKMSFNFVGKSILVTGAGRGIGRELTKAIVNAGGKVYALGRTKEHIDSLAKKSPYIYPMIVNLRDLAATRKAVEGLEALDGVVNNAAKVTASTNALAGDILTLEKMLRVNVIAPFNVIQITARKMIETGKHGSIVNVSR